jgi:hypothetical protein
MYHLYNTKERIDGGKYRDPKAMLRKWYRLGGRAAGWRMFDGDPEKHELISERDIEQGLVRRIARPAGGR